MRRKISLYSTLLATLSMVSFIGCESANNTTSDNHPAVTVENFTTQGKPTKTVQTPWGDKQVYDPTQDPEIIEAFEYVKRTHQHYGSLEKYDELKIYDELFETVRDIQYYDMGRTGCQEITRQACGVYFEVFTENKIRNSCPLPSFGSPNLDDCEQQHSSTKRDIQREDIALGLSDKTTQCSSSVFGPIGSDRRRDLLNGKETVSAYFKITCNKY